MELENAMEAQGTLVLAALAPTTATFGQVADTVTVSKNGHGLAIGDRIDVVAAAGAPDAVGVFAVATVTDANTFTFKADGNAEVAPASAMTYQAMADVEAKTFSGPGGSAAVIDATTLSSKAKRKKMGLADEGQLTFTVYYVPGNPAHEALRASRKNRRRQALEVGFSDKPTTRWYTLGFVTGFTISGAVDGLVEAQVTFEIDGEILEYRDPA